MPSPSLAVLWLVSGRETRPRQKEKKKLKKKKKKLLSYLRLEFNINFRRQGVSSGVQRDTCLKCEIATITLRNFEMILSVLPRKNNFRENRVSSQQHIKLRRLHQMTQTLSLEFSINVVQHFKEHNNAADALSSNLETHKTFPLGTFHMVVLRGVTKLSISTKVFSYLPAVPCLFISD